MVRKKDKKKMKVKPSQNWDKKARMRASTKMWFWLIALYLLLGVFYHLNNPTGSWTTDLLQGGFQQIKLWLKF
jgi:hypothetical protein